MYAPIMVVVEQYALAHRANLKEQDLKAAVRFYVWCWCGWWRGPYMGDIAREIGRSHHGDKWITTLVGHRHEDAWSDYLSRMLPPWKDGSRRWKPDG